jgi:hypothetical protein
MIMGAGRRGRGAGQVSIPIWILERRKTELKEDRNMPDNNTKY